MPLSLSGLLPSLCAVCHAWPAEPVCEACVARYAQLTARCATCALPVPPNVRRCGECLTRPSPLDACIAAVPYAYPWPSLIADFKFNANASRARPFAHLLRSMPFVERAIDSADWVLPMPLSETRLRQRGFNQAWELARRLSLHSNKADPSLLLRVVDTVAQSGLKRTERLRNLNTAFAVNPLRADLLRSSRVVLVDDVMTSGATMYAAAAVLRSAGATHITGLVLARTDIPHAATVAKQMPGGLNGMD